jgi:hypothetical protein
MIDFLDVTIPFQHDGDINGGYKDSNKKDGATNRKFYTIRIKGRNGSSIQIVSVDKQLLRIIGNPAMFIQGQNVFGTDNINALTYKMAIKVARKLGVELTLENKRSLKKGDFDIHRIDLTYNFVLPSQASVCEWVDKTAKSISSGKQVVNVIRRSTIHHFQTILLGGSSSYISLKLYNKHQQLKELLNKKRLSEVDPIMIKLIEYAKPFLRCEIRLHNQYLKEHNLTRASALTPKVIKDHYFAKFDRTYLGTSTVLPIKDIEGFGKNERLAYELWLKGGRVESLVSPSTFRRLRNSLLGLGLDIHHPFVEQVTGRDLDSYLSPGNIAKVPDFLLYTPWLFEPE